jgi:hypothetical protein
MQRVYSALGVAALTAALIVGGTSRAVAAPPGNDLIGGAVAASSGFSGVLDTSEATTDAVDAQLNQNCGAPSTDASVWYAVTVPSDGGVIVDVSSSDYSAGVIVGVGSPGALETIACGPGTVAFSATAGTTYYVLAIDDQEDGGGSGGSLQILITAAPPPPTLDLTVDGRGSFDSKTGYATLRGTYTCTDADYLDVSGEVSQTVGRIATIRGSFGFFAGGTCDGTSHRWSAQAQPNSGKFAGGKSLTVTFQYACGPFDCAYGYTEQVVRLNGGKG